MAALIAWMLVVCVDDLVKDGAISAVTRVFDALLRRRLRRSSILDKIINTNRMSSKRSRPLSGPFSRLSRAIGDAGQPHDPPPADAADEIGLGVGCGLGMAAERGVKLFSNEEALFGPRPRAQRCGQ